MVNTVGIIGLGLIGGSLARRLAERGIRVVAWNHRPHPYAQAEADGIFCKSTLAELMDAEPDVVVLCNPLKAMPAMLDSLAPLMGEHPRTTITDVGSVKGMVREQVEAAVVDGSPAQAAAQDTHRRLRAVIGLYGVGAKLQLHVLRRADERLVRRGDEARVSGVPTEGERHAQRTQQHAPPHRAAQEKPERPEHQHNARRRKPQRGREKILRRDAAERKGGAEAKERARHGSSFKPSR